MSLDKAISKSIEKEGYEKRKPYTGSKAIDRTCRNHGSCSWCAANRKHKFIVRERIMDDKLKEFYFEEAEDEAN